MDYEWINKFKEKQKTPIAIASKNKKKILYFTLLFKCLLNSEMVKWDCSSSIVLLYSVKSV